MPYLQLIVVVISVGLAAYLHGTLVAAFLLVVAALVYGVSQIFELVWGRRTEEDKAAVRRGASKAATKILSAVVSALMLLGGLIVWILMSGGDRP